MFVQTQRTLDPFQILYHVFLGFRTHSKNYITETFIYTFIFQDTDNTSLSCLLASMLMNTDLYVYLHEYYDTNNNINNTKTAFIGYVFCYFFMNVSKKWEKI